MDYSYNPPKQKFWQDHKQRYDSYISVLNIDEQSANRTLKISPRNYGLDEEILETYASLKFGATVLGIPVDSDQF